MDFRVVWPALQAELDACERGFLRRQASKQEGVPQLVAVSLGRATCS